MVVYAERPSDKERAVNQRLSEILRESISNLDPSARRALMLALENRLQSGLHNHEPAPLHLGYLIEAWALYFEALSADERETLLQQLRRDLT